MMLKDEGLFKLSKSFNVAQFASFSPGRPRLRHLVMLDQRTASPNQEMLSVITTLIERSHSGTVNVRSFRPDSPKGSPFDYGLASPKQVATLVQERASQGYYTIVNETIDVHDGGVSGVSLGGIVEFAPDNTPRAVEGNETAGLPAELASELLAIVYGSTIELFEAKRSRIEFSIHPFRVGHRRQHIVVWEVEPTRPVSLSALPRWPNGFSRIIGDKTFGLLIGHLLGLPVPRTQVVPRRIAPFHFGQSTGTGETWMRTAPTEQVPGHFSTTYGWTDPFQVLCQEDPQGLVAAILAQEAIDARFSGATVSTSEEHVIVEGVKGRGDDFMLGRRPPEQLPNRVIDDVIALMHKAERALGSVRMEWVHDGDCAWLVQLHCSQENWVQGDNPDVVSPGSATRWVEFDTEKGLEELVSLIERAKQERFGIVLAGNVGLTSHFGDVLRKAKIHAHRRLLADAEGP